MPFLKPSKKYRPLWKDAEAKVVRNGFRVAVFGNSVKEKFTGDFKNDKKHGKGTQFYSDGSSYEGDWENGKRSGHGVLSKSCGSGIYVRTYTGSWLNDLPHGFGLRNYGNGGIYKGEFVKGLREGFGCMYYADGSIYLGEWAKNSPCGIGRLINSRTANYFEGIFKKGVKCGRGRYFHVNTGQIQDGVWYQNIPKVSLMWDDKLRILAKEMTPYPIPKLELDQPKIIFTLAALPIWEKTKDCAD